MVWVTPWEMAGKRVFGILLARPKAYTVCAHLLGLYWSEHSDQRDMSEQA